MNKTINKAVEHTLILEIKRKNFDYYERAVLIQHLLEEEKVNKVDPGRAADNVAKRLGVTRKELYRIKSVLQANDNTKKLMDQGLITGDKASRVLFNLKDKSKEDQVVKKVIEKGLNSMNVEKEVAEVNDPNKVITHLYKDVQKVFDNMPGYYAKIASIQPNERKRLARLIDKCVDYLLEIKEKLK